jgi:hypothetical protein
MPNVGQITCGCWVETKINQSAFITPFARITITGKTQLHMQKSIQKLLSPLLILQINNAPEGSSKTQLQHSVTKAKEFYGKFVSASMSHRAKWVTITTVIEPALLYPFVNILFNGKDIKAIGSITSRMKCLALGLNRNFPWAILHGPTLLGGIETPSTSQKIRRTELTTSHTISAVTHPLVKNSRFPLFIHRWKSVNFSSSSPSLIYNVDTWQQSLFVFNYGRSLNHRA